MKIIITNNDENIGIIKDFENMDQGLIGQTITELLILVDELKENYKNGGEKWLDHQIGIRLGATTAIHGISLCSSTRILILLRSSVVNVDG